MEIYENSRNPVLPLKHHFPDCEAHVFSDGKLYVYGSYDAYDSTYCSDILRVVSTADMKKWEIHDVAFRGEQAFWSHDPTAPKSPGIDWSKPTPFLKRISEGHGASNVEIPKEENLPPVMLFAPDAIEKDGKYYLYFCMSDNSEGVAVSDSPVGLFSDVKRMDCGGIDPAIFVDKDGQAYYYWGQIFAKAAKLKADMTTIDQTTVVNDIVTEEEHFFHEGSSMRRRGDWYYLVFADMSRGRPTSLGYAMSRSPLGPFEYKGVIIDNTGCDPQTWNDHGSIEEFDGQWYVFYHRSSQNRNCHRRLCIEPIFFNDDGTIIEAKMTSQGAGEPFAPGEKIHAWHQCGLTGTAYLMPGGDGEQLVNISSGDTALFRYVKSDSAYRNAKLACTGSGIVRIMLDDAEVGCAEVDGGMCTVELADAGCGLRTLKLIFESSEGLIFNSITLE